MYQEPKHNSYTLAILVEEAAHHAARVDILRADVPDCPLIFGGPLELCVGEWWRGDLTDGDGINGRRLFLIEFAGMIHEECESRWENGPSPTMEDQGIYDTLIAEYGAWDFSFVPSLLFRAFKDAFGILNDTERVGFGLPDTKSQVTDIKSMQPVMDAGRVVIKEWVADIEAIHSTEAVAPPKLSINNLNDLMVKRGKSGGAA